MRAGSNSPSACSLLLQLLERELQRAEAVRLQVLADELIFALRLVDAEAAARDDVQAVLGLELEVAHGGAEHHRLDLRAAVLQREVDVAGVPHPAVRDFPLDPEVAEARLEAVADRRGQLGHGDDAAPGAGRCDRVAGLSGSSSNGSSNRSGMSAARMGEGPLAGGGAPASASTSACERFSRSIAGRLAGRLIGGDDDRVEPAGPRRRLEPGRHAGEEPAERRLDGDADDRVVRPGHADVGEVGGALSAGSARRPSARGCGCRATAVTRPSRCQPIATFSEVASAWKSTMMTRALARSASISRSDDRERIVERRHEDAAHHVDHADRLAGAGASEIAAAARHAGGEVGRAQQLRLPRDVVEDFLLVPDVIAGGHHVDAVAEDRVGDVAGDAESGGGVLDVGDDEVDGVPLDERGEAAPGDLAPRLAEDVADEQDASSGSRSIVDADLAAAPLVDARQRRCAARPP